MRYFPLTPGDRAEMLATLGLKGTDELFADIPQSILLKDPLDIPALPEPELEEHLANLASRNLHCRAMPSFLGGGIYAHYIPAAVKHLVMRSEFYTAYTPYQAEVSQGTLQAIFEFQTMVTLLTGMEVANASMYDGATAVAEAALMSAAITGKHKVLLARSLHPHYRAVLRTYTASTGLELVELPWNDRGQIDLSKVDSMDFAALIVQNPNFLGVLEPIEEATRLAHDASGLFIYACAEAASLGLLPAPGSLGADIFAGEGQSLGIPPSLGGPGLGLFATREKYMRRMPGRLIGEAHDVEGHRAFAMVLQTREQHIRREKATSNICTNQALMALSALVYLSLVGEEGFRQVAEGSYHKAHYLAKKLEEVAGIKPIFAAPFFNEFPVHLPGPARDLERFLIERGILGGIALAPIYSELGSAMLLACTEQSKRGDIDRLAEEVQAWKGGQS